jgi:hypothetical protein
MPGGFARIGASDDVAAIAMQRGGQAADVWVVSDKPVERHTLLPTEASFTRNMPGSLPSRAADNLFWLGRYIERCEATVRILRAYTPGSPKPPIRACRCWPTSATISECRYRHRGRGARQACCATSTAPSTALATSATASRPMAGWR